MRKLSNVEMVLLQIIAEKDGISGYGINHIVKERGYREWADIGMTSIYVGLKKLEDKKLVKFKVDIDKIGKGPVPKIFFLAEKGKEVLSTEIYSILSGSRERERIFDLGVAGIPFVAPEKVQEALLQRKNYLNEHLENIDKKFKKDGGHQLPVHIRYLFKHSLYLIGNEIKFIDELMRKLKKYFDGG
jgi:DNA-binding PadR family transcriptional regulator